MTDKEFWQKLGGTCRMKDPINAIIKASTLIKQAYSEDLGFICGVGHVEQNTVHQLYIKMNRPYPGQPGNRLLLCYTSRSMVMSDTLITERPEILPVRFVVDNALENPNTCGLLFNRHHETYYLIVPKRLFDPTVPPDKANKDFLRDFDLL